MNKTTLYAHDIVNTYDLYQFIRSTPFLRLLMRDHYEVYEFIDSFTLHPEIKNDWLLEALIDKGYMSGIMTYYLRHMHGLDFISYFPPKSKININKEKEKFVQREICMISMEISLSNNEWNLMKLQNPKEYDRIREKFYMDIGW